MKKHYPWKLEVFLDEEHDVNPCSSCQEEIERDEQLTGALETGLVS